MRRLALLLASALVSLPALSMPAQEPAMAGMDHMHHRQELPQGNPPAAAPPAAQQHGGHQHGSHDLAIGPAGQSYELRFIDAMVEHHRGALAMSEFVFDIGVPGVGSLAKQIWRDQAQEIKAMGQWRKAWYPEAPVYPVAYLPGGDPDSITALTRMSADQIAGMRMMDSLPSKSNRVTWFLEGMLQHHGGALTMARDALAKSTNPTILRLARNIIVAQRQEIIRIRQLLQHDGLNKPPIPGADRGGSPGINLPFGIPQ
jgi:uncharacterized protein (DUF305 family)